MATACAEGGLKFAPAILRLIDLSPIPTESTTMNATIDNKTNGAPATAATDMTVADLLAALDVTESDNAAALATVQPVLLSVLLQAAGFYAVQRNQLAENALAVAAFALCDIDEDIAKQMLVYLEDLADEMIDVDLTPETRDVFEAIQNVIPLETLEIFDDGPTEPVMVSDSDI